MLLVFFVIYKASLVWMLQLYSVEKLYENSFARHKNLCRAKD